MLKAVFGTS